jgi:hypothetical protein
MRLKLICAVLVGVLLIASGCGSKKKATSTASKATTPTTTASATGGLNLSSADCRNLIAAESTISNATSGKLPGDINAQIAAMNALAKTAPAAVRGDIATLATAAGQIAKLHLSSGQTKMTAAQTAQLMAAMSKLDLTKISAAATDLGKWAQKACASK